jgi:hypothetical protein
MTLIGGLLLVSMCLPATFAVGDYSVATPAYYSPPPPTYYSPPPPTYYSPPPPTYYSPPPPPYNPPTYYEKPVYYDTLETNVDYREANNTRRCGVQPTVHRHGFPQDKTTFGEYPWVVAILDTYQVYRCSGVLITPRHVLTAGSCVAGYNAGDIVVRLGDYDLQTDHNYLEVYKNYELAVCKKHFFYSVPQYGYDTSNQYGYSSDQQQSYYQSDDSYDAVILELKEDVDMDVYPQVEPICLPEFYYRSKTYYKEYYSGYGQSVSGAGNDKQKVNLEGSSEDLECWVVGYSYSPSEEIKYQTEKTSYNAQTYSYPAPAYAPPPAYGYGYSPPPYQPPVTYTKYVPAYSYESYSEYSLTPRRAKVHKVYEEYYQPPYYAPPPTYGYSAPPAPAPAPAKDKSESWEANYSYDTCRADVGSAIMCKVPGKYEEEDAGKGYTNYVPSYSNPPAYYAPPPAYTPSYSYTPPPYQKYKRASDYYQPAPYYSAPQYYSPPPPPAYSPPPYSPPVYTPPSYDYKVPIKAAESHNEEYRRFAVYGIVQYTTQCSYEAYESKKLKVTPIKPILPWILNVIHSPLSQCPADYVAPQYDSYYPEQTYYPAEPVYYAPPPPTYSPPPPAYYSPPPPTYYSPPPPTYYSPPPPPSYY